MFEKSSANYVVSFDTFMLQPINDGKKVTTRIIERHRETIIPRKPIHVVRKSCDYYGGSLQGSTNTAKLKLGKHHKTPIIIAHDYGRPYIFLPTLSPQADQNVWISYHAIDYFESDESGTKVHLENGKSVKVDISASTLYRQYTFAGFLEKDFLKRQKQLSRSSLSYLSDD
ncbi:competence protein ComK [Sporosarcina sp. 179-K 3D1 HS]|uniref:competence protein ComK n=1 Tax=Sporosarcina sp. 179-K 3D1 HS TaxID=3232169 RepID=UPI0039A139D0